MAMLFSFWGLQQARQVPESLGLSVVTEEQDGWAGCPTVDRYDGIYTRVVTCRVGGKSVARRKRRIRRGRWRNRVSRGRRRRGLGKDAPRRHADEVSYRCVECQYVYVSCLDESVLETRYQNFSDGINCP